MDIKDRLEPLFSKPSWAKCEDGKGCSLDYEYLYHWYDGPLAWKDKIEDQWYLIWAADWHKDEARGVYVESFMVQTVDETILANLESNNLDIRTALQSESIYLCTLESGSLVSVDVKTFEAMDAFIPDAGVFLSLL